MNTFFSYIFRRDMEEELLPLSFFQLVVATDMFTFSILFYILRRMKFPVRSPSRGFLLLLYNACVIILTKSKVWKRKPLKKYVIFYETLMRLSNISAFFHSLLWNRVWLHFVFFLLRFDKNEFSGQRFRKVNAKSEERL